MPVLPEKIANSNIFNYAMGVLPKSMFIASDVVDALPKNIFIVRSMVIGQQMHGYGWVSSSSALYSFSQILREFWREQLTR